MEPLFDVLLKLLKVSQRLLCCIINKALHRPLGLLAPAVVLVLSVLLIKHGFTPSFNGSLLQFLTPLFYFIDFTNIKACIVLDVTVDLLQSVEPDFFLLLQLPHLVPKTACLIRLFFFVADFLLAVIRIYLEERDDQPHFVAAALLIVFLP